MLFTSRIAPYIARYPPTKEKEEPPKACSQSASPGCNFARRALRVEMPHCPDHRLQADLSLLIPPLVRIDDYTPKCRAKSQDRLAIYCVQDMEMQLNEREASLVGAFRRLPPEAATEMSALVERLAELAPSHKIDWSDSWSDEDLNEFRAASLRRLDAEESEDQD